MANSAPTSKNKNTPVIILLVVLIIAVIGVGAYFIIKDATKDNSQNSQTTSTTTQTNTKTTPNNTNNTPTENTNTTTPSEIEAGITYTEVRGNDYYVEAQTNGAISGTCEISLIPSAGGTTYSDTDELDVQNKVSTCDEDFDLKKLSSGTYTVRIIINAHDGRTTTLEKSVNI